MLDSHCLLETTCLCLESFAHSTRGRPGGAQAAVLHRGVSSVCRAQVVLTGQDLPDIRGESHQTQGPQDKVDLTNTTIGLTIQNIWCVFIRLQYFARGSQNYHAQLVAALKDIDMLEKKKEQVSFSPANSPHS